MTDQQEILRLAIQERDAPWADPSATAERVIAALTASPFGPFDEMEFSFNDKWMPVDSARAIKKMARGRKAAINFRQVQCSDYTASVSRNPFQNTIVVRVPKALLPDSPADPIVTFADSMAGALPNLSWVFAHPEHKRRSLYDRLKLSTVPPCFDEFLGWYHLVTPRGYAPYFDRADLEAVPGHRALLGDDGSLRLWMEPDPFAVFRPEAHGRIREVVAYLNARRKDWK